VKTRAQIIHDATVKGRKQWAEYLALVERQVYDAYTRYAQDVQDQLLRAADEGGKIPVEKTARLNKGIKESIPVFRKSIAGYISRGISNSVDRAFMAQILALDAAGIADRLIQLGTSFVGKE